MAVEIVEQSCVGCGLCVEICPQKTLVIQDSIARPTGEDCFLCGHCRGICPEDAIRIADLPERLGLTTLKEPAELPEIRMDSESLLGLLLSRRSCRIYKEQEVARDLLADLARIGTSAASGTNSQQWRFTLLATRKEVLSLGTQVADYYRQLNRLAAHPLIRLVSQVLPANSLNLYYKNHFKAVAEALDDWDARGEDRLFHGAPAVILVSSKNSASCPLEDGMLATSTITLAAETLGLGSCLIGFAVEAIKRKPAIGHWLGLEKDEMVSSVIALGYPRHRFMRFAGRQAAELNWPERS